MNSTTAIECTVVQHNRNRVHCDIYGEKKDSKYKMYLIPGIWYRVCSITWCNSVQENVPRPINAIGVNLSPKRKRGSTYVKYHTRITSYGYGQTIMQTTINNNAKVASCPALRGRHPPAGKQRGGTISCSRIETAAAEAAEAAAAGYMLAILYTSKYSTPEYVSK